MLCRVVVGQPPTTVSVRENGSLPAETNFAGPPEVFIKTTVRRFPERVGLRNTRSTRERISDSIQTSMLEERQKRPGKGTPRTRFPGAFPHVVSLGRLNLHVFTRV